MNYIIVIFYKIVSLFSHIKKTVIRTNLEKNSELIIRFDMPKKYIENQSMFDGFHIGNKSVSYSGCGVIAVYNALATFDQSVGKNNFIGLISLFEKNGTPLRGLIGIAPSAILRFFKERQYIAEKIISSDISAVNTFSDKFDFFICLIYNDSKQINKGLHYIFVEKIKQQNGTVSFISHNPNEVSNQLYSIICKINNGKAKPLYTIGIQIS